MHLGRSRSWQIHVDQWSQAHEIPLWIRAAERIPAEGALVPARLAVDPLPEPTTDSGASLAEGWLHWWESVVRTPAPDPAAGWPPALDQSFWPPGFAGLRRWDALREIAVRRWPEAHDWHSSRKDAGLERRGNLRITEHKAVKDVERSLGRRVQPFVLELVVLPVLDDEIRQVNQRRYLVPEQIFEGDSWLGRLRRLVTTLGE